MAKVLEKYVGSSLYLVVTFLKENSHSYGKFSERLFLLYFLEFLFLVGDRKINRIYQRKLKSGDRLWALEITN